MSPPRRPGDDNRGGGGSGRGGPRRPDRRDPRAAPARGGKSPAETESESGKPARPPRGSPPRAAPPRATESRPDRAAGERLPRPPRSAEGKPPRPDRATGERLQRPERTGRPDRAAPKSPRVRSDGTVATGRGRMQPADAAPVHRKQEPQRIAKLLARAGIASRREIERMIEERRIAIDGKLLETPATIVTSLAGVTVDGKPVEAPTNARLYIFHKPTGFLTTERDPRGRPTIYDRLPPGLPRVMPIGRLDLNTEGLLLLTTDGELKRKMELPSSGIPRVYRARTYGEVTQDQLEALMDGIEIEGVRYGPIDANMERRTGRNAWIEVRITEGKNREVRRVLEYLGLQVSRLIRTAYGEFVLADLPAGELVEVRQNDLVEFRKRLR